MEYDPAHLLKMHGMDLVITHSGHFLNWEYHQDEPVIIVTAPIPANDVVLMKEYDVMELLGK